MHERCGTGMVPAPGSAILDGSHPAHDNGDTDSRWNNFSRIISND